MQKRARIASFWPEQDNKALKENIKQPPQSILLKDWISGLPPEILVDILSQLNTKEAGRTSILSRTWRYTWTSISNLDFDASEVMCDLEQKIKCIEVERPIYVSSVNEVIRRHQGQTIDQFVAVFSLDESSRSDIDKWVSFAVRKQIQRLKLGFCDLKRKMQTNCYHFPHSIEISRCSSLTSLHLAEVNITGEVLEGFFGNCLNLERVFVSGSKTLLSLNVCGPLRKLKWLDLHRCHNIEWLNISAPNMVSFKYTGPTIPMPFKDVPQLLEISIMGLYSHYLLPRLPGLSGFLSQLETLTLGIYNIKKRTEFPVLPKLKHLTLIITHYGFDSLRDYSSVVNACPSLYQFSLQVWYSLICDARGPFRVEACPHNIKVVEFLGFCDQPIQVSLAAYLIENAVMLEKITFDAVNPSSKWLKHKENKDHISARECARKLGKGLPPSVELIIA